MCRKCHSTITMIFERKLKFYALRLLFCGKRMGIYIIHTKITFKRSFANVHILVYLDQAEYRFL